MVLLEFSPDPYLADLVQSYRIVHFTFEDSKTTFCKPYPPRPEQCLNFYPRSTEIIEYKSNLKRIAGLRSVILGQQNEVTQRYIGNDFLVISAVFRPGALFRLTGIPSNELTNAYLDAEIIFDPGIKEVSDLLSKESDYHKMIVFVEQFLFKQKRKGLKEIHRLDHISHMVLKSHHSLTMDYLASESCLSLKQFERKFVQRMGVTPKYFSKIVRFEKAYTLRNKHPEMDWLSVAIQCGYYDYQHMMKDYKDLTNLSPSGFHLLDLTAPEKIFGKQCP